MLYRKELDTLLEAGKLLEIADYCKEKLGDRLYGEILTDRLRGDMIVIPDPHKVIVDLPFSAVITTNYDKLLEQAYISQGKGMPRTPTHTDIDTLGPLLFNGQFFILKAHGDIDRPGSLIFTTRDYREIIHSNPAFNAIFSAILLTKAVFFVGYSMNDPDFRLLLDRQLTTFKGNVPERYALMSGVGEIERDVLWRSARIRVLPYSEHHEVLTFLEALRDDFLRLSLKRGPDVEQKALKFTSALEPVTTYSHDLTAREVEVLRLLTQGLTSAQIAEQLVIGLVTVNSHVHSIYNKLGVNTRSAATRYAREHHLI